MEFQRLEIKDIELLRQYFKGCTSRICDCTVGGIFMWREFFKTEYAIEDGVLYLKVNDFKGQTAFAYPIGGSGEGPIRRIEKYCGDNGIPLEFCMVPEESLRMLVMTMASAEIFSDRKWYDYLYLSENMKNMAGRRYSGQRNHINKFLKLYNNWKFEKVTSANLAYVLSFVEDYVANDPKQSETLDEGDAKTLEILRNYDLYGMLGGVLIVDDKIVGASFGEVLGDTLFIHVEKALRECVGAYPMLIREFARAYATDGVDYINREEDDGDEGLRTSKMSYHPERLLEKYSVRTKTNGYN